MYNPYSQQASSTTANVYANAQPNARIVHPQPHHPQSVPDIINGNSNYQQQQQSIPNSNSYGQGAAQPGVPQGGAGTGAGFNNFFNDPKANLGFQVGQTAIAQGQQMMQNNLKPFIGSSSDLKNLFKVSNQYVLKKILLILFPFRNHSWSRLILNNPNAGNGAKSESFEVPVNDTNSPDLYIPLMSFITYILLYAILQGLKGDFHPQLFGYASSLVFGYQLLDFLVLKLGLYLLNVESNFWDLISYSNYKFIALVLSLVADNFLRNKSATTTGASHPLAFWILFSYLDFSFAFFLMRSLKQVVLGNGINTSTQTVTQKQRQKRIYFLFGYSFPFQMVLMWLLL